jgi:O-antigen ligase
MTQVAIASTLRRSGIAFRVDRRAATVAVGLALAPLLASNGGYFPTSWGWAAVGFAWIAILALLLGEAHAVSKAEWVYVGGFAAFALWMLASVAWSISPTQSPLEAQRALAFVAALLAVVTLTTRAHVHLLLGGTVIASACVCLYALSTRLFPNRLGVIDATAGYRLSSPVGYWNSLGLVASMTVLVVGAVAAGTDRRVVRALAAGVQPLLLVTLYFTFSRGAWLALFTGLVVLVAYSRARVRLIARLAAPAALAALAVVLAAHQRALTHVDASNAAAAQAGHRLAAVLVGVALAAAGAALLIDLALRRVAGPAWLPRAAAVTLGVAAVVALGAGFARFGAPQTIARDAYRSFVTPAPATGSNLNARLFNLSGSGRWIQWKVALNAFESQPFVGIGAGGYERYWLQHRPVAGKIRDAHNLYLETLAETGLVGLFVLVAAIVAPFLVLRRGRDDLLVSGAIAAYVAYLVHAAADWDWELSGVTLLAFVCGAGVLVAARSDASPRMPQRALLGAAMVVGLAGLIGLAGNIALARAGNAARAGDWRTAAANARTARAWAPWSAQPWQQLGEAQLGEGNTSAAAACFRSAIAKSPGDWNLWFDLARATTGEVQRAALDRAARFNPRSPEIAELRSEIAAQKVIDVVPKPTS